MYKKSGRKATARMLENGVLSLTPKRQLRHCVLVFPGRFTDNKRNILRLLNFLKIIAQ
jgi:hypothetical protein